VLAMDLPQPAKLTRPTEDLAKDFLLVDVDRCEEPGWRFKIMVRKDSRLGPQGQTPPTPKEPTQTLALFHRDDPLSDIEVCGHYLQREVDPADWLDLWTENVGLRVVSRRAVSGIGGADGDVVATWDTPEGPFAGRFTAMKWGRRLYQIALRTPLDAYARVADDFFVALAGFEPLQPDLDGLFAEEVNAFGGDHPVPWRVPVTASWLVSPDAIDERLVSYQATQMDQPPENRVEGQASFGKLAFGLARRSLFPTALACADTFLAELKANQATIEREDFDPEPAAREPFDTSWLLVSKATLDKPPFRSFPCEVRCRVMEHERLWFVSGVFGPSRESGALAWMQNKRTLDVLAQHIEVNVRGGTP
jgi:hypothetical protein